jgi:hypothetical protein
VLPWVALFVPFWLFIDPAVSFGQGSRCADCHFANPDAPGQEHISDWDLSPHGRKPIGCEACHGGNPDTFERFLAHQTMVSPREPASPLHHTNIPRTCGGCHAGPFVAFQRSKHYALRGGDEGAPTCVTCHGEVGAHLPSPRALESRCAGCHGKGKRVEREEFPRQARRLLEQIGDVRASLDAARELIGRVKNERRRAELLEAHEQAEIPVTEAVQAAHSFVFDNALDRLGTARERAARLLDRIVGPGE